jgi:DNA primase
MARINSLEELKAMVSPITIYSEYLHLVGSGRKRTSLCPFHKEKTPSFSIDVEKGLFYCFGCHKGGDIIKFVEEMERCSFEEAVSILARKGGVDFSFQKSERGSVEGKKRERLIEILSTSLEYFKKSLLNQDKDGGVLTYIKKRGIPEGSIKELSLGYSGNKGELLSLLLKKDFTKEECVQAGVVREGKSYEYYEYFRDRLIFPIFDLQERVVGFGGRTLTNEEPKYLNSPETPVFRKRELLYGLNLSKEFIRKENRAILVEGYMDFVSLYLKGIKNCVASLGTALTPAQASLIKRYSDNVVLLYDSDEAGKKAMERAIPILLSMNLNVNVAIIPEAKDPDDAIKILGVGEFKKRIDESVSFVDFVLYQFNLQKMATLDEKLSFLEKVAGDIAEIKDPIKKEGFLNEISSRTGISKRTISKKIDSLEKVSSSEVIEKEKEILLSVNEIILIKSLLTFNREYLSLISAIPKNILSTLNTFPLIEKLLDGQEITGEEELKTLAFVNNSCHEVVSENDIKGAIVSLKKDFCEKRRKELTAKMKDAEVKGDRELVGILLREINAVSKEANSIKMDEIK